jgi:hypothetical protein
VTASSADLVTVYGWTAIVNVECTQALVNAGTCTAEQLGTIISITNPETKAQFIDRVLRRGFMDFLRDTRMRAALKNAADAANAAGDPDVGN